MTGPGFVQGAADGSGKKVASQAVTVPAGTVITDSDGSVSTLSADAIYYRQVVALAGGPFGTVADITGEAGQGELSVGGDALAHLEAIHETLAEIRALLVMALEV